MHVTVFQLLLLITALSLDAFAASFVYGTDNVKIPVSSVSIIAGLSTFILFFFLVLGRWFGSVIPSRVTSTFSFLLLFLLGLVKFFDSTLKSWIRRSKTAQKKLCFSLFDVNFILTVYADPSIANREDISVLSPLEAFSLGIALSLDSAAAGFGAGMMVLHLPAALALSLLSNTAAVLGGSALGRILVRRSSLDLSWLSGILLLILAIAKLF